MANEVTFSKLAHDITQVSYRDLHALLDSLTELDSDESKTRLLDYVTSLRHRLIRLLVATRWHMEYSSYHLSAHSLNSIVTNRTSNLTNVADTLCAISATARSAAASASAVSHSSAILGSGIFRLPRIIEDFVGIDTLKSCKKRTDPDDPSDDSLEPPLKIGSRQNADETEPAMRVRLETRYAVRVGLPDGISVFSWSAEPEHVGVRIGLDNVWHADVLLDNPDISKANIRIMDFKILVRAHPDVLRPAFSSAQDSDSMPIPKATQQKLLHLFEDRVSWAVKDVSEDGGKARAEAGLHCLCMALSRDVCTALVMRFFREQAIALTRHRAWRSCKPALHGVGYKEGPEVPLTIEYWRDSPFKAKLSILVPDDDGYIKSDSPSAKGRPHEVVNLSHEPELPAVCAAVELNLRELSAEELILACARRRATHILSRISEEIKSGAPAITRTMLSTHSSGVETMAIEIAKTGCGLVLAVSLKSGGLSIRLRSGYDMMCYERYTAWPQLQRAMWKGERHFQDNIQGIVKVVLRVVNILVGLQKTYMFEVLGASADEATVLKWPSGASYIESRKNSDCKKFNIEPPFIGVDNMKFLSAFSWIDFADNSVINAHEQKKRVRKSPMNFLMTTDRLLFAQGKLIAPKYLQIDESDLIPRASLSARWSELRHANDLRLRRDLLLRDFEYKRLLFARDPDYKLKNSRRTPVEVSRMKLLHASEAFLVLKGTRKWQVEMKVGQGLFDEVDSTSQLVGNNGVVYKGGESPELTFAYSDHSTTALYNFRHEYMRAIRVANIIRGLDSVGSSNIRLVARNAEFVTVEAHGLDCTITLLRSSLKHEFRTVSKEGNVPVRYCIDLMKQVGEFLDSTREEMVQDLISTLLDQVLSVTAAIESVCVRGIVEVHRVRSALFIVLRFEGANKERHVIDIDMRQPMQGSVFVSDCGLAEQMKRETSVATTASGGDGSTIGKGVGEGGAGANNGIAKSNGVSNEPQAITKLSIDPIPRWKAVVGEMESKELGKSTKGGVVISIKSLVTFIERLTSPSVGEQVQ